MRRITTLRRIIFYFIIALCLAVMACSGYRLCSHQKACQMGEETYRDLKQLIRHRGENSYARVTVSDEGEYEIIPLPEVDFDALMQINPDTVGWIYGRGTRIDYPVVQTSDNDYYLHRMFNRSDGICGTIFLDYECAPDFTDFNSVTYGHHMRSGSMYHDLTLYKEQSFYDEHPTMILAAPDHTYVVQLFAGFVARAGSEAWQVSFEELEDRQKWLDWLLSQSCFRGKLTPTIRDRILTLSTCSYEFKDARFVLYGILTQVR